MIRNFLITINDETVNDDEFEDRIEKIEIINAIEKVPGLKVLNIEEGV